jgi:single-strand DNA-binding protein
MNIAGRLVRDAQVRNIESLNRQVVNFSVAANEVWKDAAGEVIKVTTYFNCAYWRSTEVADKLKKGTKVELTGFLKSRMWKTEEGEPKVSLDFRTDEIKLPLMAAKKADDGIAPVAEGNSPSAKNNREEAVPDDLPF